jgi:phosphatidylglycerophosphate synthase
VALAFWLANRALDGIDGPLARVAGPTDLGGYLDLASDLAVYAGFVVAVAIAVPDARLASAALLAAYYVNAGAWLSYSALAERRRLAGGDERSIRFVPGLAGSTETLLVYVLFCLLPGHAAAIAWAFAALVALSASQRVVLAVRTL